MNSTELRDQAVTLLPDREALGRHSVNITLASVHASNSATSVVLGSYCSSSFAGAAQTIVIG
jgi:hypothetical protein